MNPKKKKVLELLFLVTFVLWLAWRLLQSSVLSFAEGSRANTLIHFVLLAFFAISSLRALVINRSFFACFGFFVLGLLIKYFANDFLFCDLAVIAYACRGTDFKKIAVVSALSLSLISLFLAAMSLLGAIPNLVIYRGDEERFCLGFLYCTTLSHVYLNVVLLWLYVRQERITWVELILITAINIFIYAFTDSRNSFYLVMLTVLVVVLLKFKKFDIALNSRLFKGLGAYSFVVLAILSLILTIAYNPDNGAWKLVNRVSSNRLAQTQSSLERYGLTFFGQEIDYAGNGYRVTDEGLVAQVELVDNPDSNLIDNSYMNILVCDGLIAWLASLLLFFMGGIGVSRKENILASLSLFMIAAHSFMDPQLLTLTCNVFFLLITTEAFKIIEVNAD